MKPRALHRYSYMRFRVLYLLILALVVTRAAPVRADDVGWQDGESQLWGYEHDFGDPSSAMRLRIQQTADRTVHRAGGWALNPCPQAGPGNVRAFCWSSYGRDLRMVLPKLAFNALAALRPHTLYSYQSLDVRFPPALRLRLPFDATTSVGYEYDDDLLGIRIRVPF